MAEKQGAPFRTLERVPLTREWVKENTYTAPGGTKFVFEEDIKRCILKDDYARWAKKSRGSTGILVAGYMLGIYPYDIEKFLDIEERFGRGN